jgi:serine/threonine-protein kinase
MAYSTDCDPNVLTPIPANGRIEGYDDYVCPGRTDGDPEGDCHMIVADFGSNTLYESYQATVSGGAFYSTCNIAWNMTRDVWGAPPAPGSTLPSVAQRNWGIGRDCTGPDAAGFPMAPLLFTIGDILSGRVEHAIRFALPNPRMQRAAASGDELPVYVWPATHAGGPQAFNPNAPIYGSRWRLKPNFDPTSRGLDPNNAVVKAIVYGLQHYGMLLADGGEIALMGEDSTGCSTTWDDLWGNSGSRVLNGIRPSDFDVLDTGGTDAGWDCERNAR